MHINVVNRDRGKIAIQHCSSLEFLGTIKRKKEIVIFNILCTLNLLNSERI